MKCKVCGRRMNTQESGFLCHGCGHTEKFRPIGDVIEELEGDFSSLPISEETFKAAADALISKSDSSSGPKPSDKKKSKSKKKTSKRTVKKTSKSKAKGKK